MENTQVSAKKIIINYGLLLGIVSVVFGVILYVTDSYMDQNWMHSLIGFLILIGAIVYGIKAYKTANGGFLTLGEGIKVGIGIALVGGLISVVWTLLLMQVIEPDMMERMAEVSREKMQEQYPDFTQEQLDQSAAMAEKFSSPFIISAFSLLFNLFFGFIFALIASLVMQKKQTFN
ncbi:DUF4199 domain-containing protein [Aquimarina intermedia]|uniref:Uncharacterized protein DUF4199 n=1 Tax=Aquimarina intermedia TaxID=350814 RepID=A0A5S5C148_9FLAO|nr:DUF4199 domain-containing protein [Aquimarina intermedia]TYP71683.1 uncharacterized protein DUF4199 [Aquimarina intermedia]